MARSVRATPRRPTTIEMSALFGRFQVPGSDFTVRYASTFASPGVEGHRELLAELKPMRDRVEASAISDLTALLQRDLNDRRVARQLIPYLLGDAEHVQARIGFFPAVLAVLVPRGYLAQRAENGPAISYPASQDDPDGEVVAYRRDGQVHSAWEVERYLDSTESAQPVGLLRINPHETDVVVLDGQHRSTAFRYLAGDFDPSEEIYGDFYRGIERPADFSSDLPVTIIWFEARNNARVEPRLISRQLFVDVNNSALAVSAARTILLDDRSVSAIATQAFYNRAAEAAFRPDSFSLLHSAFDMDSDLAEAVLPSLALTSPEIAEAAFLWLLLGSNRYSDLGSWSVDRLRAQRNRNRFVRVLGSADNVSFGTEEDEDIVQVDGPERAEAYRRLMRERVAPALWNLVDGGITLLEAHYTAAAALQRWVEEEAGVDERTAWRKIFAGGEGLYWTFRDRVPERNLYRQASTNIERWFRQERGRELGVDPAVADAAFKSFVTKAFQVGFVMAADYLAEKGVGGGDLVRASEELVTSLGRYTPQNWLVFFREIRPLLIRGDTAPKIWPTYRNLLVRMYDEGRDTLLDDADDYPEQHAFEQALDALARRRAQDYDELPGADEILAWVESERDCIADIFQRAGMHASWFSEPRTVERGRSYFVGAFEDL